MAQSVRTHLQDQETLVVQVYSLGFKQSRHFSKGAGPIVDSVFGRIVSISCTGDDDLRVRNELECISSGLTNETEADQTPSLGSIPSNLAYKINNLPEPDLHPTKVQIFEPCRIVDEFRQFALSHLACSIAKDKEHGVDGVGFTGTVGTDDGGE